MINEVRNTVLTILNKNNYGYISPSDFNLVATNAQMELYEEYYSNFNKTVNMENNRMSGTEYANISKPLMEVLETFSESKFLTHYANNKFYLPSLVTTGDAAYMINKILVYPVQITSGTTTSGSLTQLIDSGANFVTAGIKPYDIALNLNTGEYAEVLTVVSPTTLTLDSGIFQSTTQDYVIVSSSSINEAEKVTHSKITMLNNSLLTSPSNLFPAYTQEGELLSVYPKGLNYTGSVLANYFRYPKEPKWTYITLTNGEPVFDQTQPDYQDFELPNEDGYKLVVKICQYFGVSIRESEVTQFAMAQEQHEQPSFSMQQ